jgi:putative transposase
MSERQYRLLETESRKRTTLRQYGERIAILLRASQGQSNGHIKRELGLSLMTVKSWRKRWQQAYARLFAFEQGPDGQGISDSALLKQLLTVLQDLPRSGTPKIITLAQEQQLVALACRKPADFALPHTTWTHQLLAQVAIQEGLVPRISSRYVGTILKKAALATPQKPVLAVSNY